MSKRILAVDDSTSMRQMVVFTLKGAGYAVQEAADGQQALDIAKTSQFDLVLSDVNMPVMDGFEATEKIRSHEQDKDLTQIPILALTANVLDDFKLRCKQAGMNDFLTKPIKREVVFAAIQKWVRASGS